MLEFKGHFRSKSSEGSLWGHLESISGLISEHLDPIWCVLFEEAMEPLGGIAYRTLGVSFQFTVSWCVDEMLLASFLF